METNNPLMKNVAEEEGITQKGAWGTYFHINVRETPKTIIVGPWKVRHYIKCEFTTAVREVILLIFVLS